ncbi:MAG: carbohydrate ABC transporter permease [Actinomycetota bacterium]
MSGSNTGPIVGGNRAVGHAISLGTWLIALLFFFPIFWMVLTGFKTDADAHAGQSLFFSPTLESYNEVLESQEGQFNATGIDGAFAVSAWTSVVSTFVVMLLAIPAAYSLAIRPVAKWRDVLFFFISTKFLPVVAAILPLFFIARFLDLLNSRLLLIILYTAMNLPLAIWMLRSFFAEVPKELIEASQMDGAKLLGQIRSVILPIAAPGLAATALLCLIFAWNEFFLAIQLNLLDARTVPNWAFSAVSTRDLFLGRLSAASTLATLPVVIAGWVAQKRMIRGLAMGAIK